ncbi:MAG: bifunctional pyr operon transcriptional regulator/uracil phosphoribosyltransferase PyrR [bacterium]
MTAKRSSRKRSTIMDSGQLERALARMAHQIIEATEGAKDLALVGMQTRGVDLALRLARLIKASADREIPVGVLDVTLYRDDFRNRGKTPEVRPSDIPYEVDGKILILVDDVLFTGRTVRAALDCLMDYGRPRAIRLAVLIDRGHRELPIRPDFTGQEVKTAEGEEILVRVLEHDDEDAVYLVEAPE